MTPRHKLKQRTSFHTQTLNLSGNPTETSVPSASQTKPTTEAPKCRPHPCQSMLQIHHFRSLKKIAWTDNNHGNKQEPITRQNMLVAHTTLPTEAPQHAGLITKKIPTQTEQLDHNEEAKALKRAKQNSNDKQNRRRTIYFCIGCGIIWSEPVQSIIKWSVCVSPQMILQPQRDLSRRSVKETDSQLNLPRL